MNFLPINKQDMLERGWEIPDFVVVTGDAYVDHPSFGIAIISRYLEARGFKVCVLSQPDWKSAEDFQRFGKPRLGFLISSGNVDSMVNHFSVMKKRRRTDSYSPGGQVGRRPDRALIVYSQRAREAYKDVPIILGGLEASLRRLAHYDYWDNKVRRSILLDAKADLLVYGMGEKTIGEIAEALESGISIGDIKWVKGTVFKVKEKELGDLDAPIFLPDYSTISASDGKKLYAKSFQLQYENNDSAYGKTLLEPYTEQLYVAQNPPQEPLKKEELDSVYELPYMGYAHPMYETMGGVPAIEEVKFSLVSSRGCFGGCGFCALTYHQGKHVQGRSKTSIVQEAIRMTQREDFKGYIHDVGGPTANFRKPACVKQEKSGTCTHRDCLFPQPCNNLQVEHGEYLDILRELRNLDKVKKVFIRSGLRFDYLMKDRDVTFMEELCEHHVSGTLKVAPEHSEHEVLRLMRKPPIQVFDRFAKEYKAINKRLGKKQYLIPYFISSHPGSTLESAVKLMEYLKKTGFVPDQVQDFYPTPGTLSTCMFYAEMDPLTGESVYVPKDPEEKNMQRALLHFHKPENKRLVQKALQLTGKISSNESDKLNRRRK